MASVRITIGEKLETFLYVVSNVQKLCFQRTWSKEELLAANRWMTIFQYIWKDISYNSIHMYFERKVPWCVSEKKSQNASRNDISKNIWWLFFITLLVFEFHVYSKVNNISSFDYQKFFFLYFVFHCQIISSFEVIYNIFQICFLYCFSNITFIPQSVNLWPFFQNRVRMKY